MSTLAYNIGYLSINEPYYLIFSKQGTQITVQRPHFPTSEEQPVQLLAERLEPVPDLVGLTELVCDA